MQSCNDNRPDAEAQKASNCWIAKEMGTSKSETMSINELEKYSLPYWRRLGPQLDYTRVSLRRRDSTIYEETLP